MMTVFHWFEEVFPSLPRSKSPNLKNGLYHLSGVSFGAGTGAVVDKKIVCENIVGQEISLRSDHVSWKKCEGAMRPVLSHLHRCCVSAVGNGKIIRVP